VKPTGETTGTEFTEATTEHNANPNGVPPLLSAAGEALAKKTAPANALIVNTAASPTNPQQDSMLSIFRRGT
jgi:hypothetical protein